MPFDAAWRSLSDAAGLPAARTPGGDVLVGLSYGLTPAAPLTGLPGDLMSVSLDGRVNWRTALGASAEFGTVAGDGRTAFATWSDVGGRTAGAWDGRTGAAVWRRPVSAGKMVAEPGGGVVLSDPAGAVLVEADGSERWRVRTAATFQPVGLSGRSVIGTVGELFRPRAVVAISLGTGRREWTYRPGAWIASVATTPARVYVGTEEGMVTALSARSPR